MSPWFYDWGNIVIDSQFDDACPFFRHLFSLISKTFLLLFWPCYCSNLDMKKLIIIALALISFSSFAKVCELELVLSEDATHIKLLLTDKDVVEIDSEMIEAIIGGKRELTSCKELAKMLEVRDLKAEIDGVITPVIIVNQSIEPRVELLKD